jgi:hypothetical protein
VRLDQGDMTSTLRTTSNTVRRVGTEGREEDAA